MKIKQGVNPFGIKIELLLALNIASEVWREFNQELVITSLNDSVHSNTSLHYAGYAADLRTRYFSSEGEINKVAERLRAKLGSNYDYDVIVEKNHIHLEYQPKFRGIK